MGLMSAITKLTGITPSVSSPSTRKWPKYVKPKTTFKSADGKTVVRLDKNYQVIYMLKETIIDGKPAMLQVHPEYKGRPCKVENGSLLMAETCLIDEMPVFDYYQLLIDQIGK